MIVNYDYEETRIYFEPKEEDFKVVKNLKEMGMTIWVDHTGPFGEYKGARILSFKMKDAKGENPRKYADRTTLVVLTRKIGQSDANWSDWYNIAEDCFIYQTDYEDYITKYPELEKICNIKDSNKKDIVHEVEYDMEVESFKLNKAKKILKENGFIIKEANKKIDEKKLNHQVYKELEKRGWEGMGVLYAGLSGSDYMSMFPTKTWFDENSGEYGYKKQDSFWFWIYLNCEDDNGNICNCIDIRLIPYEKSIQIKLKNLDVKTIADLIEQKYKYCEEHFELKYCKYWDN